MELEHPDVILAAVNVLKRRTYYPTSESSSSSDEDWDDAVKLRKREPRPRIQNYVTVVDSYLDYEFKSHFRMSRKTFNVVLDIIRDDLVRKVEGCPTIPSRLQLMIALWKMATMDSYRSVCDRFDVGRATAVRAVRRVTHALYKRAPTFIQWPSGNRAVEVMRGFEVASAFPKVIGAIDGTHIKIDAPKEKAADYINRKGFHSLQLQLVCDHRTLITHAFAGYPGSVHDQRVFRHTEVVEYLNENEKFPDDSHILGDAAYKIHQHLLIPYRDNGHLTQRQKNFNYRHSAARAAVERCIGLLKGRMRSLLHCLPMTRVDLMPEYIIACCVVHNICTLQGDEIQVISVPPPNSSSTTNINEGYGGVNERRPNLGIHKRNLIKDTLLQL